MIINDEKITFTYCRIQKELAKEALFVLFGEKIIQTERLK
jgi:hypothetical protein